MRFQWLCTCCLYAVSLGCDEGAPAPQSEPVFRQFTQAQADASPNNLWTRQVGEDWPSFLGARRNGKSTEHGIIKDWAAGNLRVVWKTPVGEGYAIGSVSRGRYFHFDVIRNQARLRCLNAETGELLWKFEYPSHYKDLYEYDSGPRASPVIDGDRIYLFGVEGMLHCLSVSNGKPIWKIDTERKFGVIQNFFGVASTPLISGDLLLVMVGGSPEESKEVAPGQLNLVKPNQSAIVAFDKLTGEIKYVIGDDLASYSSIVAARLGNQNVGFAWCRKHLIGFNVADGEILSQFAWRARKLESVNASTPVVSVDRVFLSECYGPGSVLLDVSARQPRVVWSDKGRRDQSMKTHWNTPILHEGNLYGSSGQDSAGAQLRCIEMDSGKVRWSQPGLGRSSLTYVDGHLVVMSERGRLLLIRATPEKYEPVTAYGSGTGANQINFASPCWAAPIIAHGLMYVRGRKQVVCLDLIPNIPNGGHKSDGSGD